MAGKGFVQIVNPEDYKLVPGILTQTGTERFSVALYHQLHCIVVFTLCGTEDVE